MATFTFTASTCCLLSTSFMADVYDTSTDTYQNLLKGNNRAYISPYYAPK